MAKYVPSVEADVLPACKLNWWRIYGFAEFDGGVTKYERKGWLGITVDGPTPHEIKLIKQWERSHKKVVFMTRNNYSNDKGRAFNHIGDYEGNCINLWFATEKLLNSFVEMLDGFPKRNQVVLVKNFGTVEPLMSGNYKVVTGRKMTAVAFTDEIDEVTATLIRLSV